MVSDVVYKTVVRCASVYSSLDPPTDSTDTTRRGGLSLHAAKSVSQFKSLIVDKFIVGLFMFAVSLGSTTLTISRRLSDPGLKINFFFSLRNFLFLFLITQSSCRQHVTI